MTALAILVKFTIPDGAMDKFMEAAHHDASIRCRMNKTASNSVFWSRTMNQTASTSSKSTMIKHPMNIANNHTTPFIRKSPKRLALPVNGLALPHESDQRSAE